MLNLETLQENHIKFQSKTVKRIIPRDVAEFEGDDKKNSKTTSSRILGADFASQDSSSIFFFFFKRSKQESIFDVSL